MFSIVVLVMIDFKKSNPWFVACENSLYYSIWACWKYFFFFRGWYNRSEYTVYVFDMLIFKKRIVKLSSCGINFLVMFK